MNFLHRILWLSCLPISLFSCALCFIYDPTVYVDMTLRVEQNVLKAVNIRWEFSEVYTQKAIIQYDADKNGRLDSKEWKKLQSEFSSALLDRQVHTQFGMDGELVAVRPEQIDQAGFDMREGLLLFLYTLRLEKPVAEGTITKFLFKDQEGFFGFFIREEGMIVESDEPWRLAEDSNFYSEVTFLRLVQKAESISVESKTAKPRIRPEKPASILLWLAGRLNALLLEIQSLLQETDRSGSLGAWVGLIAFSFFYGAVHALGPGHGKTLVGLYFLSGERKIVQAWKIAGGIGIIHVLSAFVLTLFAYTLAQIAADRMSEDFQVGANAISGGVILLIAGVMLYRKLFSGTTHEHSHCGCGCETQDQKSDLGIAFAAGAIPCPGTVLVFMTVFTVGSYLSGILSAFAMSLGMAVIVGLSASFSAGIRHVLKERFLILLKSMEWLALFLMVTLGSVMLLGVAG